MSKQAVEVFRRFLWLLPVPLVWLLLLQFKQLSFLENWAMDMRFRARGEVDAPVKLVYVDLDAETITEYLGEKPWPRGLYGSIAEILLVIGQAKAVGFDLVMSQFAGSILVPDEIIEQDSQQFAEVTNYYPNIILAAAYTEGQELPLYYKDTFDPKTNDWPETPHFQFTQRFGPPNQCGLINFDYDLGGDSVPRWVPMFTRLYSEDFGQTYTYYHIALQLARVGYGLPPEAIKRYDDRIDLVDNDGKILLSVPLWEKQMLEVNFFSRFYSEKNPRVSMYTVAKAYTLLTDEEASQAQKAEAEAFFTQFKDAIILIGPTDPLLQDIAPTPFDSVEVPKVGVHGNVLKTIFSGLYIKRKPVWFTQILVLGLTMVVALMFTTTGRHSTTLKLAAVMILIGYVYLVFSSFEQYHFVLPLMAPVGSAISASLIGVIVQLVIEEKHKGRIKGMFGTYLSPELVNRMVESGEEPQLGGIDATITAYFSDVQSFSSFSEILTPNQLVDLMNEYLTAMTDILMEKGCYVDKYIGDAIVGILNAPVEVPDHALRGCVASQLMQKRQAELRAKWKSEGDKWPPIVSQMQTRMGLNTGHATVGNMGSERRFNYTMMGDTVNLAARCESGAKAYGVYTMITGETRAAAEEFGDGCVFRYLDKIVVKGRTRPAEVYEIMGLREDMTDEAWDCLAIYDEGIKKYLAQDWDGALERFEKALLLEPNRPERNPYAPTTPSKVLIERTRAMKANPPEAAWDGVYVMTTK